MHSMTMRTVVAIAAAAATLVTAYPAGAQAASRLSAVWANEGGDKVLQHERRAAQARPRNSIRDGATIRLVGARSEVVHFALVLESAAGAGEVSVRFDKLADAAGHTIASLRLKYWRRGVQDADYLALANAVDPVATRAIVERMVPRVLWETGVTELWDPTWLRADIS